MELRKRGESDHAHASQDVQTLKKQSVDLQTKMGELRADIATLQALLKDRETKDTAWLSTVHGFDSLQLLLLNSVQLRSRLFAEKKNRLGEMRTTLAELIAQRAELGKEATDAAEVNTSMAQKIEGETAGVEARSEVQQRVNKLRAGIQQVSLKV